MLNDTLFTGYSKKLFVFENEDEDYKALKVVTDVYNFFKIRGYNPSQYIVYRGEIVNDFRKYVKLNATNKDEVFQAFSHLDDEYEAHHIFYQLAVTGAFNTEESIKQLIQRISEQLARKKNIKEYSNLCLDEYKNNERSDKLPFLLFVKTKNNEHMSLKDFTELYEQIYETSKKHGATKYMMNGFQFRLQILDILNHLYKKVDPNYKLFGLDRYRLEQDIITLVELLIRMNFEALNKSYPDNI